MEDTTETAEAARAAGAAPRDLEFSVGGERLRYRDEGAGPAVLLLHGWTLDLDMWEGQARALRDSFRVIRYDRRGFGLSAGRPSVAHDITDALALCRHLGVRSVAVVGMSQGARVAAYIAAANPGLVSCVVFDGPPGGVLLGIEAGEGDVPVAAYRELVRVGGMGAFLEAWRAHPLVRLRTGDVGAGELVEKMLGRYRGEDLPEAGSGAAAGDPTPPQAPRGELIRCPALVMSGAFDLGSRRRAGDALAEALPAAERVIVPESGHLANLDNPTVYNLVLRGFLERFAT